MDRIPDLNETVPNLWQGSRHSIFKYLVRYGFKVLVFCAEEWQPPRSMFPSSIEVIYAPNSDDPLREPTRNELLRAVQAGREGATAVRRGKKVLTTCMAGLNLSGLVNALALHFITGDDGTTCMNLIHRQRPRALSNPQFQRVLSRVPAIREVSMISLS